MSVSIREIADLAGVSRGTVDRVLNGRPGVKPSIREKVLKLAGELNYTPHLAAKALALAKKPVSFGIIIPPREITFFDEVRNGIHVAENELKDFGVRLEYRYVSNIDPRESVISMEELVNAGVSGILFSAMDDETIKAMINQTVAKGIPVITFNSDVKNCARLCFVGQDLYQSGRLAAGLMTRVTGKEAKVIVVTGNMQFQAHKARVQGFSDRLAEIHSSIEIVDILQGYDRYSDTYDELMAAIAKNRNIQGIYMSCGNVGACCDVLKKCGLEKSLHVICNDTVPDVVQGMQEGIIDFTIVQNPFMQGYKSMKILFDYIYSSKIPENEYFYTETNILLLENLKP